MSSDLWKYNIENHVVINTDEKFNNFKRNSVNFKISLWNPSTNGVRYLKMLTYNMAKSLSKKQKKIIANTKNRNIGNPISVNLEEDICLDYIQAALEVDYISHLNPRTVLEIGPGYGRTCHAIISNLDIDEYVIIDLAECIEISRRYLFNVLENDEFKKITFVKAKDFFKLKSKSFDIAINIDSFAEMNPKSVNDYLSLINDTSEAFYVKNPVGKYMDKDLDNHADGEHVVKKALSSGLLTDIIDIHSSDEVKKYSQSFLRVYSPGEKWKVICDSWSPPISYYWNAIYKKNHTI